MTRKRIIDLLRTHGKNNIAGKKLENCYSFELMIAMQKETNDWEIA